MSTREAGNVAVKELEDLKRILEISHEASSAEKVRFEGDLKLMLSSFKIAQLLLEKELYVSQSMKQSQVWRLCKTLWPQNSARTSSSVIFVMKRSFSNGRKSPNLKFVYNSRTFFRGGNVAS